MAKPVLVMPPRWNWGLLVPARGYSRCYRCRLPWWATRSPHIVPFSATGGQFALCGPCWGKSDPDMRWHAHNFACSGPGWSEEETLAILRYADG